MAHGITIDLRHAEIQNKIDQFSNPLEVTKTSRDRTLRGKARIRARKAKNRGEVHNG